jgi:hypothetical protein
MTKRQNQIDVWVSKIKSRTSYPSLPQMAGHSTQIMTSDLQSGRDFEYRVCKIAPEIDDSQGTVKPRCKASLYFQDFKQSEGTLFLRSCRRLWAIPGVIVGSTGNEGLGCTSGEETGYSVFHSFIYPLSLGLYRDNKFNLADYDVRSMSQRHGASSGYGR